MSEDIRAFLRGNEETDPSDDIRGFLRDTERSEKLSREMTHSTFKKSDFSIRPSIITQNIKKGFADFASLPGYAVDLVNWPLHKLGVTPKKAFGGSAQIRKGYHLMTDYQPQEPLNAAEEYAAKAAEFLGAGMLISAKAGTMAATEAANILAPTTRLAAMKEKMQMAKAGISAASFDALASIAGGIGAETTGSVFEHGLGKDFRGTGELIGGMSLSMMPYYIKNLMGGASNIKATVKDPAIQKDVMNNAAKQQVLDAMGKSPHAEINLERAIELQAKIKGFNPNLAAATDSPGLKAFQESLDSKSVSNLNRSSEAIEKSMGEIQNYYRRIMPVMDDAIVPKMRGQFEKGRVRLKKGISKTEAELAKIESRFDRRPTQKIGERLIELKGERLKEIKTQKSEKYNELYKSAKELDVNAQVDDIKILAEDITKADSNAFQNMPSVYGKIKALFKGKEPEFALFEKEADIAPTIKGAGEPVYASFDKLHSLSREVNREYGKALRSGDSAKEYYLNQIRNVVDNKLKGFDDPVFGDFAKHKKATDTWWLNEYYNVFKQGLGSNIDYKTIRGEMTAPEKIIEKLVLNKGTKGLEQFNKLYQDLPEAQILLRDGIIDSLAKDVANKGLKQKTLDSFVTKHKEILDDIPDLRNTLSDTGATIATLTNRRSQAIAASKKFIDFRNSKHAKAAGFDDIQEALHVGFKDKKMMKTIMASAKTKAEKQDLATGVGDYILNNKNPWSFIAENEKAIKPILNELGPNHFKNVKDVSEAMDIMGRYRLPQMPARSTATTDPLHKATGTSVVSAFAQFRWAFFYGKTSAVYPFVDIGSKYLFKLRQGHVDRLIEQSIYDPDLAKIMSTMATRKTVPLKLWSDLSKIALKNGIKASSVGVAE